MVCLESVQRHLQTSYSTSNMTFCRNWKWLSVWPDVRIKNDQFFQKFPIKFFFKSDVFLNSLESFKKFGQLLWLNFSPKPHKIAQLSQLLNVHLQFRSIRINLRYVYLIFRMFLIMHHFCQSGKILPNLVTLVLAFTNIVNLPPLEPVQ